MQSRTPQDAVSGDALRLRVADHGEWFSTRSQGREVWKAAIGLFADNEHVDSMILDFDGVQAITTTCADEMVAGLITRMDDRRISVAGTSDQIADAITTALARRGLAVEGIGEQVFFAALATRERELADLRGQLEEAEAAVSRVRELHSESPYKQGQCCCANSHPCPTIRALDGQDGDDRV